MVFLFNFIIAFIVGAVDGAMNSNVRGIVYSLALLIPGFAVSVRRLHDTSRTGWWILIGLIPVIGAIVLIVFYALDGVPGDNQYGADPKGAAM